MLKKKSYLGIDSIGFSLCYGVGLDICSIVKLFPCFPFSCAGRVYCEQKGGLVVGILAFVILVRDSVFKRWFWCNHNSRSKSYVLSCLITSTSKYLARDCYK